MGKCKLEASAIHVLMQAKCDRGGRGSVREVAVKSRSINQSNEKWLKGAFVLDGLVICG